jgi:hypothetical protein
MVVFTGIAAVISYQDGLFLIRFLGAVGWSAFLYPLLPDGLILISSIRLYETAPRRPGWAMGGVILGVALTLVMNAGAGVLHNWMYALADACVPVVFFVALENLRGDVRGGRGEALAPDARPAPDQPGSSAPEGVPAGPGAGPEPGPGEPDIEPAEPLTRDAALLALLGTGSRQEIADVFGVPKSRVVRLHQRLTKPVQPGPEEALDEGFGGIRDAGSAAVDEPIWSTAGV